MVAWRLEAAAWWNCSQNVTLSFGHTDYFYLGEKSRIFANLGEQEALTDPNTPPVLLDSSHFPET